MKGAWGMYFVGLIGLRDICMELAADEIVPARRKRLLRAADRCERADRWVGAAKTDRTVDRRLSGRRVTGCEAYARATILESGG